MNLGDVMDQVADRLATVGLRAYGYPVDGPPQPPAATLAYPETITFDESYGRGQDRIDMQVWVLVGKVVDRATRDTVSAYVDGSGDKSVKQVLESGTYTAFDTVRVVDVEFDAVRVGAVDFLAAGFRLDIVGSGSS